MYLYSKNKLEFSDLRRVFWGESFFTSVYYNDARPLFLDDHMDRLAKSKNYLWPKIDFKWSVLQDEITKISKDFKGPTYLKIIMFLESNGILGNLAKGVIRFLLETKNIDNISAEKTVMLKVMEREKEDFPSFLKRCDYLKTELDLQNALNTGFDDVLYVNKDGNICDTSIANIFLKKGDVIFTPLKSKDVLDGVLRNNLFRIWSSLGQKYKEQDLTMDDLLTADYAFVSNSIKGISQIISVDGNSVAEDNVWVRKMVNSCVEIWTK